MTPTWFDKRKKALHWLMTTFPESIAIKVPLKVGVFEQIREFESEDKPALIWLRRAMWFHTSRASYLKNIIAGAKRFDLMGVAEGEVLETEAENAKTRLTEIKSQQAEVKRKRLTKKHFFAKKETEKEKEEPTPAPAKVNPVTGRKILTLKKKALC